MIVGACWLLRLASVVLEKKRIISSLHVLYWIEKRVAVFGLLPNSGRGVNSQLLSYTLTALSTTTSTELLLQLLATKIHIIQIKYAPISCQNTWIV